LKLHLLLLLLQAPLLWLLLLLLLLLLPLACWVRLQLVTPASTAAE
jgi:hypothetical protein